MSRKKKINTKYSPEFKIEYLEAENEYIKKLSALVYAEEQKSGKKRK